LAYIGVTPYKGGVLNRNHVTLGQPKILCGTAKHDQATPLAIVTHLEKILNALDIFDRRTLGLAEQSAKSQLMAVDRATAGVNVEIDAQDWVLRVTLKFKRLTDIGVDMHSCLHLLYCLLAWKSL